MSFRDEAANKNLGICVVEADTATDAMEKINAKKINPGGEILFFPLNQEEFEAQGLELDRFYNPEEIKEKGFKKIHEE
jgi:hypothetical protein